MTTPATAATGWKPLAGYRVLDLADEKGQLAGRLLADLGADVIKVETPRRGDRTRASGPFYRDQPGPENSLFWWAMNAGKRSVTCALQVEAGRGLFRRLVATADIVIETSEPGSQAALGLDYPTLSAANPRIIVVSVSDWGQASPLSDGKHFSNDLIASAMSGLMHFDPDNDEAAPWRTSMPQALVHVNTRAALAATAALYARGDSGAGCHLDISLAEAATLAAGGRSEATPGQGAQLFVTADGYVATPPLGGLCGPEGPALIDWLVATGGAADLGSSLWRSRLANGSLEPSDRAIVEGILARFCSTRPKAALVAEAQERGSAWAPVNSIRDAVESEHLAARGAWTTVVHDDNGEAFRYPAVPWSIGGADRGAPARAPHIGEHNAEVFTGLLGIDENEVRRLRTRMVV